MRITATTVQGYAKTTMRRILDFHFHFQTALIAREISVQGPIIPAETAGRLTWTCPSLCASCGRGVWRSSRPVATAGRSRPYRAAANRAIGAGRPGRPGRPCRCCRATTTSAWSPVRWSCPTATRWNLWAPACRRSVAAHFWAYRPERFVAAMGLQIKYRNWLIFVYDAETIIFAW